MSPLERLVRLTWVACSVLVLLLAFAFLVSAGAMLLAGDLLYCALFLVGFAPLFLAGIGLAGAVAGDERRRLAREDALLRPDECHGARPAAGERAGGGCL